MTTEKKTASKKAQADAMEMSSKITDGAREMVKRSTATVKERAEDLHDTSKKYNTQLESVLTRAAGGYVNILGSIADAAYSNLNHTIAAVEKLADAKSVSEAMQIQSEYVREHTAANVEHVRSAATYARDVVAENTGSLRDAYGKMWPMNKSAA
jgi:hypothetical protein